MPISNSYPKGIPVEDQDLFLGTKAYNNRTVNYTAQGIADYLNINSKFSIGGQMSFQFVTAPNVAKTIAFDGGGGDNTAFSAITKLIVSAVDASTANITIFLNYLNNSQVLLSEQNQPNFFGHYKITGYTQIGTSAFYELDLEFIGGNGTIIDKQYYDLVSFVLTSGSGATPTLQEVTDEGSTTTNSIIIEDNSIIINSIENNTSFDIDGYVLIGTDLSANTPTFQLGYDGLMTAYDPYRLSFIQSLRFDTTGDTLQNYEFPSKPTGTYTIATTDDITSGGVTSVGLTMPSAFTVTNSPITSSGDIAVTGAGLVSQYVRGDGTLANFPNSTGGGSSVNYYLNGSVSQGTFGGDTYYQMSKTPILGAGTNFTRTNEAGDGYIASFITDAGDPSFLNIPGGNWNLEFYFNASSGGGSPSFYAELYKVSATNVFTLIASDSLNPEGITNGTTVDQYFTSIPVPQTTLLVTDRLAIRIYVITSGRTITLHTENGNLCEVLTTFTTGLTALNGLTQQVQNLAVGTSGTDFAISSVTDTHTFNLPTASAVNRGALSSTDWNIFNNKQNALGYTPYKFVQTSQTAHTGTTAETIVATAIINGGTFNSSDSMKMFFKLTKQNGSAAVFRLKINTTNSLVGATQIALSNFTSLTNTYIFGIRNYDLQGGNLYGYNFNSSLILDIVNTNTVGSSTAYNTANTLYIFFTLQLSNPAFSVIPNLCEIRN
jgi:hypothetical protein